MTRVTLEALTKSYPGTAMPALDRLSLEIESGALAALLGPSGCGKTTALKIVAGLLAPSSGDVRFDGRSVLGRRPEQRGAVMVFQNHLLFPYMSVADNVGFGLRMRRLPRPEIARRVDEMLEMVRLPDLGARRPAELSGGQQQRVALARALILRPEVLLLDEPLSNLDAHLRLEMRDLIRGLQREMGITTIFVTHDQEEAVVLADRVALILGGRLKQVDAPEAFYSRPADGDVARFFGARNFVPGHAAGGVFEAPVGRLRLPAGAPDGPGTLTIRPENLRLSNRPGENRVVMRLADRLFLGTRTRLVVEAAGTRLEAVVAPGEAAGLTLGDEVTVHLPAGALWVLPPEAGRR